LEVTSKTVGMPNKPLPSEIRGPVELGDVSATGLAVAIRVHVGLDPCEPPPHRDLPDHEPTDLVLQLDLRGLVGWALLGFRLLAGELTMSEIVHEVRRFAAATAVRRHGGHRGRAAEDLRISRFVLTKHLGLDREEANGTRIVAVESFTDAEVRIYGRGRYVGQARPPNGTPTKLGMVTDAWPRAFYVPKLELDDGTVIWGPQCTWMTEAEFARMHGGREERVVPPP
jgi:hypothetical protein